MAGFLMITLDTPGHCSRTSCKRMRTGIRAITANRDVFMRRNGDIFLFQKLQGLMIEILLPMPDKMIQMSRDDTLTLPDNVLHDRFLVIRGCFSFNH